MHGLAAVWWQSGSFVGSESAANSASERAHAAGAKDWSTSGAVSPAWSRGTPEANDIPTWYLMIDIFMDTKSVQMNTGSISWYTRNIVLGLYSIIYCSRIPLWQYKSKAKHLLTLTQSY